VIDDNEYSVNDDFQQTALTLSDQVNIDEIEAARYLLDSSADPETLGRSLLECSIIRFHQQRKYALDALRLLLELDSAGDDIDDDVTSMEAVQIYVAERVFKSGPGIKGAENRLVPRCMTAMQAIKADLLKLGDKIAAAQTLGQGALNSLSEEAETIEYTRISLVQQHELLAVILCRSVDKHQADRSDFSNFMATLQKVDKYDSLLGMFDYPRKMSCN
jgi:nuclear pore complex protein Nup205